MTFHLAAFLTTGPSLDDALVAATRNLPPASRIGIMPWANATIPTVA